jgi:uncharacterized caspase-like protein
MVAWLPHSAKYGRLPLQFYSIAQNHVTLTTKRAIPIMERRYSKASFMRVRPLCDSALNDDYATRSFCLI